MTCLYITGAGVSADSGIPTFRGHDGFWTIGSRNYTPQEMATRRMYLENPAQFLLWYFKRFAAYRHVRPNAVHGWLAAQCNGGAARLITQNIDGLDGKAGHRDYVAIHGRLDKMTVLHDQAIFDRDPGGASGQTPQTPQTPLIDAPWDRVSAAVNEAVSIPIDDPQNDPQNDKILTAALLDACQIPATGPQMGVSLKPYVLLFDEYYTDLYRMTEAEQWMAAAERMVFMGTSFSVNITAIALRTAVHRGIPVEIVDPNPVDLADMFAIPAGMADITYHEKTAQEWIGEGG